VPPLGSALLCLDCLSRPKALAHLYPKLLNGYLLDAIEHLDVAPADWARLEGFVGAVTAAPGRREPPRSRRGRAALREGPRRLGAGAGGRAAPALWVQYRIGRFGHLAAGSPGREDRRMFYRRLEPALTEHDVATMFRALWNIHGVALDILRILKEEFDGEAEADEP
jgi:hypothetical protein